jgi:hypothetical protein
VFLTKPCLPGALLREVHRVLAPSHSRDARDTTTTGTLDTIVASPECADNLSVD